MSFEYNSSSTKSLDCVTLGNFLGQLSHLVKRMNNDYISKDAQRKETKKICNNHKSSFLLEDTQ